MASCDLFFLGHAAVKGTSCTVVEGAIVFIYLRGTTRILDTDGANFVIVLFAQLQSCGIKTPRPDAYRWVKVLPSFHVPTRADRTGNGTRTVFSQRLSVRAFSHPYRVRL
jgi:hypothetical protein